MIDIVDRLKELSRTRGFPQASLYTKEHRQADLDAIAEIERLRHALDLEVKLRQTMAALLQERADWPTGIRPGKRRAVRRVGEPE